MEAIRLCPAGLSGIQSEEPKSTSAAPAAQRSVDARERLYQIART